MPAGAMTHRRTFLARAATALGAGAVAPLVLADRALGDALRELDGLLREDGAARSDSAARRVREEYLLGPDVVYLNHASIGTIPRTVLEAHRAYLAVCETNPWLYMWGGAWEEPREAVRRKAARALGCEAPDVAITHNTTEGFNVLAQGLPLGPGDEVLFSSLNHPGASVCFEHRARERGYTVRSFPFPIERAPELSAADVIQAHVDRIRPETRLLVFPHVDNIVGVRHPLAALSAAAHDAGVEFVAADGAQTAGMLELDVGGSGVDFYAASPHKWVQSPKGLGLLFAREDARDALRPMWMTWGQTRWANTVRRFEDYGTRNLPAVLALGDALDVQHAIGHRAKAARYRHLFDRLRVRAAEVPGFGWASPGRYEDGAALVSVTLDGVEAPEFSERMLEHGFVFRPFRTRDLNAVRLSPNMMTTVEELERFFEIGGARLSEG